MIIEHFFTWEYTIVARKDDLPGKCVELFPEITRYGLSEVKSMEMDHNNRIIYPELPKIWIKKSGLSEVICVQLRTKSSGPWHFIRNWLRSGLNESGLNEVYLSYNS